MLDFLTTLFKAIIEVIGLTKKTAFEKEQDAQAKVDQEHDANEKTGRPSRSFWKNRL